jgi:hypothetical protein
VINLDAFSVLDSLIIDGTNVELLRLKILDYVVGTDVLLDHLLCIGAIVTSFTPEINPGGSIITNRDLLLSLVWGLPFLELR